MTALLIHVRTEPRAWILLEVIAVIVSLDTLVTTVKQVKIYKVIEMETLLPNTVQVTTKSFLCARGNDNVQISFLLGIEKMLLVCNFNL